MTRRTAAVAWIALSLGYAVARISLADRFLRRYGLNTFWFALIELAATLVFSVASARFVGAVLDRRNRETFGWLGLTVLGFLAADIYAIAVTRELPAHVELTMFGAISAGIVATIVGLYLQLRSNDARGHVPSESQDVSRKTNRG